MTTNLRTLFRALVTGAMIVLAASAAEDTKKTYNLPAGKAASTLKTFSEVSGKETLFAAETVRGVKTNPVKGELTAREALEALLDKTGLIAVTDEKTGAVAIQREADPKNADRRQATDLLPAVKLETVRVLGTRIRQTDAAGPSPVSTFDKEYIKATGAMTLADFLNRIPQTYSGIASGRASTPNELNPEFGQRTETSSPAFNFVLGVADAPPGQTGVSGVSLRGLGSGSTLVLVDGRRVTQSGAGNRSSDTRQGFVDLNTIPLSMIERVEVITDGASAIYGADAVAGVINIILKKDYSGTELSGGYRASEHGGGRERTLAMTHGFAYGKLSGLVSLEYFDRQNLKASDRSFSKNQNHAGIPTGTLLSTGETLYGRDFRLNWGYPAVIQAVGGTVSGTFNSLPGIRVVLVPPGATATPAVSGFIPVTNPVPPNTVVNATGQRRANTASFLDLIPKSERTGVSGNMTYRVDDRVQVYTSYRTSTTRSLFASQPVTSITGGFGTAANLPAAFNPFNQTVSIGMVLNEFGSLSQSVKTVDNAAVFGVRGKAGQTWQWDVGATWERQTSAQVTRNFNPAGFVPLITNADPSLRFNPFIDASAPGAPSQRAQLDTLAVYPSIRSKSKAAGADFSADGDLFETWGGATKMAFGGLTTRNDAGYTSVSYSALAVPVATSTTVAGGQQTNAIFAEFQLPVFGKPNALPMLYRLDLQLASRYESVGPFNKSVPKYGVSWNPVKSILLRGSWSEGFRAPGVTEYLTTPTVQAQTLTDPRRTPPSTPGVSVTSGSNPDPQPETSENAFAGIVYEPPFIKGLNVQVNYYDTKQAQVLQLLSAQVIINNEALFPDRVTRLAAGPADQALNQPGQIIAVSRVFVNFGRVINRSIDYAVDYTLPWRSLGTWRLNVAASRTLTSSFQLAPGQPPVILDDDTASPPKWKINGSLFWHEGPWSASAFVWYMDGFRSNNAGNMLVANNASATYYKTPSVTQLDLNLGYEFTNGIWRNHGKGVRLTGGVSNVFDKKPPFSDTVWGFNAGLHNQLILGRAYEFSFVLPF